MTRFTPTVSIIVAVYNGADMIGTCIESLLNQDYPADKYDIIIVENGSTDNTAEVVQRYPIRFVQSRARGKQAALNLAIGHSDAEIIAMTDADCIADPQWLSRLVQPYSDPEVGGVGGLIAPYVHAKRSIIERFSELQNPLINYMSGDNEFLPHLYGANCSYRRVLLNQVGNYDTRLPISDDTDICWRVQIKTGKRIVYAEDAIIYHHHRSTRQGLARQYYHYGYGEIIIDALYQRLPGYPRTLPVQLWRITGQMIALIRYLISMAVWRIRYYRGKATDFDLARPHLMFLVELSNVRGKIDALIASRLMTVPKRLLRNESDVTYNLDRFFQTKKM